MLKKRLALLLALTLSGANAPVFAAGILTFDAAAELANAQQWAKELNQWKETAQHYSSQMDAYKAQLATATGLRDIGSFVNQAKGLTSDLKNLQKKWPVAEQCVEFRRDERRTGQHLQQILDVRHLQ
jgi:type IV secretion system protein VirB5